jgi:hypothetical protein
MVHIFVWSSVLGPYGKHVGYGHVALQTDKYYVAIA